MKPFGEIDSKKIKKARLEKGFTSYQKFCDALNKFVPGLSKTTVWKWENGTNPNASSLFAICRVTGKRPEYFLK